MRQSVPSDRQIALLAARQYGHVTHAQLIDLGFTRHSIASRVKNGRLIPVHSGVYAVGHVRPEAIARAAAAVLACGPDAVLSYFSAAALWGFTSKWPSLPEVTVPARRRPAGIRVHVHPTLESHEIRRHRGIRVTSPARTLLDIAPRLTDAALARAVSEGRLSGPLRLSNLAALLKRRPHHPGASRLRPFVQQPTGPTRSEFEDYFLTFAKRYGLPAPEVNVRVGGYLVDALFPAERLVVELDGWEYHQDRRSFELDRERDAALAELGYETIRITWRRLTEAADREAKRLRSILRQRGRREG